MRRPGRCRPCERVHGFVSVNVMIRTWSVITMCCPVGLREQACLLQGSYGVLMVDARDARHVLRGNLNFANDRAFEERIAGG